MEDIGPAFGDGKCDGSGAEYDVIIVIHDGYFGVEKLDVDTNNQDFFIL